MALLSQSLAYAAIAKSGAFWFPQGYRHAYGAIELFIALNASRNARIKDGCPMKTF
jgi:hypothetical protein